MKKLVLLIVFILFAITTQAQNTKVKKDSVPLFFGMTSEKLLALSIPEAKKMIKNKGITPQEYLAAKRKARIYLLKRQSLKDSVETIRTYDRIEKKLTVKKTNGKK